MTATGQNVEMYQGDDKRIFIVVYDENDNLLDITNCEFNWVVFKRYPENIVLNKTTASGISIVDPINGLVRITLIPADTENLLGEYNHELELTDTSFLVSTITVGTFTIFRSRA